MSAEETLAYLHAHHWQDSRPGLHRIRALLSALGNPQNDLRFVHVAGTNGKGSTCAVIASVLRAAGLRVGLNTSPYLLRFNERIQVDGVNISDEALEALTKRMRPVAEAMAEPPTEFELITALALLYFREKHCDIVVLEVGLGGEKDASNVIDTPEVAVITAMGMDHVAELGPTLADIAAAKAGIIKPCGAVVSYGGCPVADGVLRRRCAVVGASLTEVDFSRLDILESGLTGSRFHFSPHGPLRIPLAGTYQIRNAATAITALELLQKKGWPITEDALVRGLAQVQWPGRLELLRHGPDFLLDGAHNPHGMAATAESLRALLPDRKIVFLLGVMADKDVSAMLPLLAAQAAAFVTVRPNNPRAMAAETLRDLLVPAGLPVHACADVAEGVGLAMETAGAEGVVCALGSLYLSGDVRRAVEALKESASF